MAAVAADDNEDSLMEVRLGDSYTRAPLAPEASDPFMNKAEDIKSYDGLGANIRRRTTRELNKAYTGAEGTGSKKREVDEITGYGMFDVVYPPYNLDYLAKVHEISPANYAANWAKAANIVGLGYDFELSESAKLKLEDIDDQKKVSRARRRLALAKIELVKILSSWNQEDDILETLTKMWIDYESTGNGYLEIGRKRNGEIGYLGHIPSASMRIRKSRDGYVQIVDNKAVFFKNFGDKRNFNPLDGDTRPNEVMHFKKYSPTNGYYGVPDIIAAQNAIAGNEFSARYNLDYFENKAVPRYVIVVKGGKLSDRSQKQLLEFFQVGLKGKNHRTIFVPLPADEGDRKSSFEMKPVEAGPQDSSFNNYRKANLADILMAHRVPIGKVTQTEGASLAASRDADKTFKEQVCGPQQKILMNKLAKIFDEVTDIFYFRLNELALTDENTQSQIDERNVRNGILLPNEVRQRMGRQGIKGGDKRVDLNAQPAASAKPDQRDIERGAGRTDSNGTSRQPKGEGRTVSNGSAGNAPPKGP